ncbi:acyl-CoA wax alcohol acyltransferase 1-like [Paramacrobiotus metropolitanus]|uniref:acyl-CoA wax alcohol acyltransferase 1-like n=1 Tax=Paramacrobiotus metropolitanus TaxID=2943436 RepID=UPI002445C52F|nr:acyl-CoA wax alcohol acyltransferase 1-like [Paramacrobiotus metropolitanus]
MLELLTNDEKSLQRGLQTFAVALHLFIVFFLGSVILLFYVFMPVIFYFFPSRWYILPLLYLVWYVYDWDQSSRGGHRWPAFQRSIFWHWVRDYFPVRLIKTAELDPRKKYLMAGHPHGPTMAFGFITAMCTEALGFRKMFPGINVRALGQKFMMQVPVLREYTMAFGICDVSRPSIDYWMAKGPGTAVAIVIGGAREIFEIDCHNVKLVLRTRKGFVKAAIQHGAELVPMFAFGENDTYELAFHRDSIVYRFQRFIQKKVLGFCPALIKGRGFFGGSGLLPKRIPITVVIGAPIPVEENPHPSHAEIDALHQRYLQELHKLFDTHKASCGYPDAQLSYID